MQGQEGIAQAVPFVFAVAGASGVAAGDCSGFADGGVRGVRG